MNVNKEIDDIIEDLMIGHNFEYAGKALKELFKKISTDKVTRFEVIDHTKSIEDGGGRTVVFYNPSKQIELQLQDDDRTLKVFIHERSE